MPSYSYNFNPCHQKSLYIEAGPYSVTRNASLPLNILKWLLTQTHDSPWNKLGECQPRDIRGAC